MPQSTESQSVSHAVVDLPDASMAGSVRGENRCLCCGSRATGPGIASGGYRYATCLHCRSAALAPLPSDAAAAEIYRQGYFDAAEVGGYADYAGDERLHRWNARRRLAILGRHQAGGELLEVGSALGFFLDEARVAGYRVAGVDVSRWARRWSREHTGLEIEARIVALAPGRFDVACCFQVLEHIPRCDRTLAEIHQQLRSGGLLVIETWDRTSAVARLFGKRWQQITPPSVVHLFSRAGIGRLLGRQGFAPLRYLRTLKWTSLGFAAGLLAWKRRGSSATAARRPPLARSRVGAIPLPYCFGDLVTVVARKQ